MKVQELKPTIRVFGFSQIDKCIPSSEMKAIIDCESWILHIESIYRYHIKIKQRTGDVIRDLISMTREELLSASSLEKRFLLEESKSLVLKNLEDAMADIELSEQDPNVKRVVNLIMDISPDYFFEDITREQNATLFKQNVRSILRNSPFREMSDNIVDSIVAHQSLAVSVADMIVKHLYPILQRELNLRSDEISKEEILAGLQNDLVRIINNSADGCIAAMIGEHWFYFTGIEDESMSAETYLDLYNYNEIADMIHKTINEAPIKDPTDDFEWRYYKCILNRC